MKDLLKLANKALAEGHLVRITNDHVKGSSQLLVDGELVWSRQDTIVYPGFLNCTKPGTPCRVLAVEQGLGFGAEHAKHWSDYTLCLSHTYNAHDFSNNDEDLYFGSDKYFEDGHEASVCCY